MTDAETLRLLDDGGLFAELVRRASGEGLYLIARASERQGRALAVVNGQTERVASSASRGIGLHLFTPEGACAFGSVDGLHPEDALAAFDRIAAGARAAAGMGAVPNQAFRTARTFSAQLGPVGRLPFDRIDLDAARRTALALDAERRGRFPGLSVRTGLSFEREEWRIVRSDGTDAAWAVNRFVATQAMTASGADGSFTCRASVSSPHFDAMEGDESVRDRLGRRADLAAHHAAALPSAGRFSASGPLPLLIDYALAKGLAHEAFGHAAEADSFRSSVLARAGRFRRGERVGRDGVSVIDEPLRGDHADQPVSSNGQPRRRVEIVRSGILHEPLSDLFTAEGGGETSSGCERAESYACPPISRMSNIRIEMEAPLPLPLPVEETGPAALHQLLGESGLLDRYPRIACLAGYTGGQVNPVRGDFIFNCQVLYEATASGIVMHRPSAFRGSILGALRSLASGFGPLQLDAIGTCGKWGQSVPSCGGSHAFVFLEPDPSVGVGA